MKNKFLRSIILIISFFCATAALAVRTDPIPSLNDHSAIVNISLSDKVYSLQLNTYIYESAALRFFTSLPIELANKAFLYKTNSGYFTIRIGRVNEIDKLKEYENIVIRHGYSYSRVNSDPKKINSASPANRFSQAPSGQAVNNDKHNTTKYGPAFNVTQEKESSLIQDKPVLAKNTLRESKNVNTLKEQENNSKTEVAPSPGTQKIPFKINKMAEADSVVIDNVESGIDTEQKTILNLSLQEAIFQALKGNREVQISSLNPSIAAEETKSAQSVYDPYIFTENYFSETNRPVQSILDNGSAEDDAFIEHKSAMKAGVKKSLKTGGMLSLFANYDYLNSSSEFVTPNPQYTSRITTEIRQALLKEFGDKSNRTTIEISNRSHEIARAEFNKTISLIIKEVASSYWRVAYYQKQQITDTMALEDAKIIYQREKTRNEKGLSNLLDVDRAYAIVQERHRDLIISDKHLTLSIEQLILRFGSELDSRDLDIDIIATDKLSESQFSFNHEKAIDRALQIRPESVMARQMVEVANLEKMLATHLKLPKLDAKASYSYNALDTNIADAFGDIASTEHGSWAIGLEFEYPLGNRKSSAQYQKKMLRFEQAQNNLNKANEQIIYEIKSALKAIKQAKKEIEAARLTKEANERVLQREHARFEMAQTNYRGLLDAQADFYDAERNYNRAILDFNLSLINLKWAKGSLSEDFGIKLARK